MNSVLNNYPKQRISFSQKTANKNKWGRRMVDTLADYASNFRQASDANGLKDYHRMIANYRLYNNQINQSDFSRELDLLGIYEGEKYQDVVQPYNKTYNKINRILTEERKRRFNYRASLTNDEGFLSYLAEKQKRLKEFFMFEVERQKAIMAQRQASTGDSRYLNQQTETEQQTVMDPATLEKFMNTDYQEAREITANKLLKYYTYEQQMLDKRNDAFKHGLLSGKEFIYVGVHNGKPYIEVLNPLNVFYHKSPEVKFVEDGLFAGYTKLMHPHEVLDRWRDVLEPKDIKDLEGENVGITGLEKPGKDMNYKFSNIEMTFFDAQKGVWTEGSYDSRDGEEIEVVHVEWRSERKIGFLTYQDESGEVQETIVDEAFQLQPELGHIDIKWEWIPEIWEGTRIGSDIYVDVQPKPYQFFSEDDPAAHRKLGYHGAVYANMNAEPISMMDRMKPYQFLYFIVMHKLLDLIKHDEGKILMLDSSMIDPDLDLDKTLFYLKATKIQVYNSLQDADQPGAVNRKLPTNTIDYSNAQNIINYIGILDNLDRQIGEVAGVPREREGQTEQYSAVTNNQQNIVESSYLTEGYFIMHNMIWENVLNSFVNMAQIALADSNRNIMWLDGTSRFVISQEDIREFTNQDFAVFITDNPRDNEIFETIKQLTQAMIQNDKANISDIISILTSDSVEEAKREITAFERKRAEQEQAMQKAQMEHEQKLQEYAKEMQEDQQAHEMDKIDKEYSWKIELEKVEAIGLANLGVKDSDQNDNGVPDVLEIEKLRIDREKMAREDSNKDKDRQLKREELATKERIEKRKASAKTTSSKSK